jgi:hypothetical protein
MVFIKDEGAFFDAPLEDIWKFLGSGKAHSEAHQHRKVRRRALGENSGIYSWEQDFRGKPQRFSMEWRSYYPLGIGYEVVQGPFEGSKFFLIYTPDGARTGISLVGEFISPEIAQKCIKDYIKAFFDLEFDQDSEALLKFKAEIGK